MSAYIHMHVYIYIYVYDLEYMCLGISSSLIYISLNTIDIVCLYKEKERTNTCRNKNLSTNQKR